ncbi:hypothetical protein Taro_049324 [Colocasia esculenta]|uniref:Uncharacterized protein n=1 Tax=Colocasia esculenta TaxID=4460 RepID=A0A843XAM2_COLES|nr:hypothetical protein [Colocasia esculenta]
MRKLLKKIGLIILLLCRGHWSVVILCHEEEDDLSLIMLLDSLHSIDPTKLVRPIQRFHNKPMALSVGFLYYITSTISYRMIHPHFPWMITHLLYSDINKKSKSHHKYFHCAGTKSFVDINEEETKLQEVKITQPSSSSSSSIASADDIYSQVFGKERPGRVRGVGTGPTPTSLWGTSSQCQAQLRAENAQLNAMVKELSDRLGKVESIVVEVELDET